MLGLHVYTNLTQQTWAEIPVIASPATAPPRTLSFQGKLNDASNTPITAETKLRFAIYKSQTGSGSAQLWEETQTVRPDPEGTFSVLLGKKRILRQDIFTNYPSLFLGISVGNESELQPRQPLANVTNATTANSLQGLRPITESDAGTRNVVLALDSSGNLTIGGNANPVFQVTNGEFTLSGQILTLTTNPGSNANVQIKPDGSGIIDLQKPLQNTSNYNNIESAAGALEIDDLVAILATSSGQSAFTINQNGNGPIISASASGIAKFTLDHEGNGFFGGNISLNGNKLTSSSKAFELLNTDAAAISFGGAATSIGIGASTGTTTINNNLKVKGTIEGQVNATGLFTANGGLAVPTGKSLTLAEFDKGAIPFINSNHEVVQDSKNFVWDAQNKRLGIGTNVPTSALTVLGIPTGSGVALVIDDNGNILKNTSSRRYKDDIKPLQTNTLALLNTAPVSFKYKETGSYDIGYLAEDFDALGLKDLVLYDKDGKPNAIKYDKLSIFILELVKEQQKTLNTLQSTLGTIKAGYIQIQHIATNSIAIVTEDITIGGQTMKDYVASMISNNEYSNKTTSQSTMENPSASSSASQTVNQIETNSPQASSSAGLIDPIASSSSNILSNINDLYNNVSTPSGTASPSGAVLEQSGVASASGLTNSEPKSPLFQPGNLLNIKFQGPQTDYANIASYSADLAFVPNFKSDYATFNQGLIALGPTSLTDVGVSNGIVVGGNLEISDNSINTIASDLNLQPLRQGKVAIMGGLVNIDTEGNLAVGGNANFAKNVTVNGKLAAGIIAPVPGSDVIIQLEDKKQEGTNDKQSSSLAVRNASGTTVAAINQAGDITASGEANFATIASKTFKIVRGAQADTSLTETVADGSAGTGLITAYERERTIRTPYVTPNSLIYVTATSNTQQVTPYVARQTANSFTVQIPSVVSKDISFNWWIVN